MPALMKLKELKRFLMEKLSIYPVPTAAESLSSFLADYGIVLHGLGWNAAAGQSDCICIVMSHERFSSVIDTTIAPVIRSDDRSSVRGDALSGPYRLLSLSQILYVLHPELQFEPGRGCGSFHKTREEITRQLRLIEQYCRPMLQGDFSAWPVIVERFEILRGPAEDDTLEMWASRMRQMLSGALENERHFLVSSICWNLNRLGVELTREEKAAWQRADKELQ